MLPCFTPFARLEVASFSLKKQLLMPPSIKPPHIADSASYSSEQQQSLAAIFCTPEKCSQFLDLVSDGVILMDAELRVLYFNATAERLLGRERVQIIGRNLFEAFPEARGSIFEQHYTRAAKERITSTFEVYFDTEPYVGWYRVNAVPTEAGVAAFFQVVTEQVDAKQALRISNEQLALAMDAGNQGLWDWNLAEDTVFFNESYYTMLGYERDEFPPSYATWEALLHPDDRESAVAIVQQTLRPTGGDDMAQEFRLQTKDGGWRWIYTKGRVIQRDEDGKAMRFIGTHSDINNRKAMQESLERRVRELGVLYELSRAMTSSLDMEEVVRHAFDTVVEVLSPDYVTFYVHREGAMHELLRYPQRLAEPRQAQPCMHASCLCGMSWKSGEAILAEDVANDFKELSICCREQGMRSMAAFPIVLDGEVAGLLHVAFSYPKPLYAEKVFLEAVTSIIASNMRTIRLHNSLQHTVTHLEASTQALETARQELEGRVDERTAELSNALERLKETDALKSAFLTNVSHDLRTPLTSILGFARIVQREFVKHFTPCAQNSHILQRKAATIEHNLDIIASEGARLTRLINDFLDLSRIEEGHVQWNDESLPLKDVLDRALQSAQGFFVHKPDVELHVEVDEDLPHLTLDPDRIIQVVVNLLSNAAKFTQAGVVSLRATVEDNAVVVSVGDDGIGIAPSQLERIFDKFYQIGSDTLPSSPTMTGTAAGSGVGLSICKQIIEHYGGKIWATSQVGLGSTFSFSLPCALAETPATSGDAGATA